MATRSVIVEMAFSPGVAAHAAAAQAEPTTALDLGVVPRVSGAAS